MTDLPFDEVHLRDSTGVEHHLTPVQFLALPLPERVRALLRKELHFFKSGVQVEQEVALAALRASDCIRP